jgi:hypothetical protein
MSKIKELKDKYGIHAALVGGSLVIGSTLGTCTLSPEGVEAPTVEESAPEVPAPAEEPKPEGEAAEAE